MNKLQFPNRVTIELTNRCNISCTFCHRNDFDMKLGNMTDELYKKIINEMAENLPVAMVPFFRGESLLHPHFIEYIQYAKEKGIGPIQFTSNGLLFNKDMAKKLIEAGVDFASFSLDTIDEKLYSVSRRHGNLKKSMENVEAFAVMCKEYREKGIKTPTIQVSTVDIDEYRNEQKEFIEYWKKYADVVRVYEEHDNNGRFRNKEVSDRLQAVGARKPCRKLYTDMVIYWDGNISLCCYDWNETHSFGNVNNMTMKEIWNSDEMNALRKMHETDTITDDYICKECEHWKADYVDQKFLGKVYM